MHTWNTITTTRYFATHMSPSGTKRWGSSAGSGNVLPSQAVVYSLRHPKEFYTSKICDTLKDWYQVLLDAGQQIAHASCTEEEKKLCTDIIFFLRQDVLDMYTECMRMQLCNGSEWVQAKRRLETHMAECHAYLEYYKRVCHSDATSS
ncbi:hypothetical protein COU76_02420 [Candidatus Peregrinibacteria bacterium CG10_big_fil_rev_8_21_14_0_10_49_10]|nr:MAG: hypothetical protein COU76_02420 [Candidatus Peregrinibacteria bacterium CG10_big_fil_rev_8_21_14_0_10_49_10]